MSRLRRQVKSPVIWILAVSLAVSVGSLVISLSDNGFSEENLFVIYAILRYSTIIALACSVYLFLKNIYYLIRRRSKVFICILKILLCLFLVALCIGFFYMEAFIIVFSAGNSAGNAGGT